jgi:transketolase
MRVAFVRELTELARRDDRIVLLFGDIGNRMFDEFRSLFPDRAYNCGVAEANMTSMAAGLAMAGLRPVTYTIAPFSTTRCLEQIRVDICYHDLPVVIVGLGAGMCYAEGGATHQALEDIAHLRVLPNMSVLCPGDAMEVRALMRAAFANDGPVYLRLGKKNEPVVHEAQPDLAIGRGLIVREGTEVCLLSTGNILTEAVEAAEALERQGHSTRLVSLHTVKPLDVQLLRQCFSSFKLVVTLEEHRLLGGAGSAVAEWLADQGPWPARLLRMGTPDAFLCKPWRQAQVRKSFGLDAQSVQQRVSDFLRDLRD